MQASEVWGGVVCSVKQLEGIKSPCSFEHLAHAFRRSPRDALIHEMVARATKFELVQDGSRWFKYRQVCSSIISSSATTVVPCIVPIASGLSADSTALCRLRMALDMSQRPDWWNNIEEWRDDNGNYARIAALQLTATNHWISELLSARPHTVSSAPCPRFKVCCDLKRITWWWRPTNLTR